MQYPKQFAEVSIAESPESYEAYLYRFKNLENQKIYLGIHKGYVGDGYWHSSTDKVFAKDFAEVSKAPLAINAFEASSLISSRFSLCFSLISCLFYWIAAVLLFIDFH